MDEVTKPVTTPKSQGAKRKQAAQDAARAQLQSQPQPARGEVDAADEPLSPVAIDGLADIAKSTNRLVRLRAEHLKTDDGYRVIDPKTVAGAMQEFYQTGQLNHERLVHEHLRFWADKGQ